ncbi:hypothetical protein Efla_005163 [Eimeria flavescens]
MTTFIVEGRCDCTRVARCQLLADRLMTLLPSVTIRTEIFEPSEYQDRLACLARSFSNFSLSHNSEGPVVYTEEGHLVGDDAAFIRLVVEKYKIEEVEPDLDEQGLQKALKRLVECNTKSLRKQKERAANGPKITEEAEARTQALVEELSADSLLQGDAGSQNGHRASRQRGGGRGFRVPRGVKVERSVDEGANFAVWTSPDVDSAYAFNSNLQLQCECMRSAFLLNATIPRGARPAACDFRLLLHEEPLARNHLVLVPNDCVGRRKRTGDQVTLCMALVTELQWEGLFPQLVRKCQQRLHVAWLLKDAPADTEGEVYRVPPADYSTKLPELFKSASAARCILFGGSPTSVMCRAFRALQRCVKFVRQIAPQEESVALKEAGASPDLCLILGDAGALPDKMKAAVAALECPIRQLGFDKQDQSHLEKIARVLEEAVDSCRAEKEDGVSVQVFRRAHRRSSSLLETRDWAAAAEVLDSLNGLVTFQLFPESWRDHRRPLDTHLQAFPFPIPPIPKDSPFHTFSFAHFIQRALSRKAVFMPEVPFLHALVRVLPEEPLAACIERQQTEEDKEEAGVAPSFAVAYSQALDIICRLPSVSWDVSKAAQSIVLGSNFLLLVPHPFPEAADCHAGSSGFLGAASSCLWRQWPPPHPLAFAGGAVGFPALRRAWMDAEDPRQSLVVAFQPLDLADNGAYQQSSLALNESALKRPLQMLSLSCCSWRPSESQVELGPSSA